MIDGDKLSLKEKPNNSLVYSDCKFIFKGDEWKQCAAAAIFERSKEKYASIISKDGLCEIPDELQEERFFRINVIRRKNKVTSTTNTVLVAKEV